MKTKLFVVFFVLTILVIVNSTYSDPTVGINKLTIKEGWNLVSLPLQTLQIGEGKITTLGTNTVSDSTKSWTEDYFQNHILLISSGDAEGYYYRVSSNTADTITLQSELSSSISTDDYFYVYKAYTLEEIFGDEDGPLYASNNINDADEIFLWDQETQAFSTSIWLSNLPGSEGWLQGSTSITDNSITLIPNEACFIIHKLADDVTVSFLGVVPDTKQAVSLKAGENIIGSSFPEDVTMADSGLSDVLESGTSPYVADNIYQWNYTDQKFELPIWHSNSPGYENWYRGAEIADDLSLSSGSGITINNRTNATMWQREKPYSTP